MSTIEDCKKPFHKHIMIRGFANKPPRDTETVILWLKGFIEFLGMKILQGPFSSYVDVVGNRGITAVAMIETSHIAFHVWDEQEPALLQFDVYTCGSLDVPATINEIKSFFDLGDFEYLVYDREDGFELVMNKSSAEL